jgi:4-hydroxymandelate oxidase
LPVYFSDLAASYQLEYHDEVRQSGLGQSFAEMGQPLLESLVPADQPVDLVVLAFQLHDLRPGQATSIYLSHICPGDPLGLTVCDQGAASPFTGLRLIQAHALTGSVRRAVLLVAEQATVHYDLAGPARLPEQHVAVALLFDADGGYELAPIRQRAGIQPEEVRSVLATEVAALGREPAGRTLVLGAGLDPGLAAGIAAEEVVTAPSGQPCAGAWWELVGGLPGWQAEGRQLVIADYEPALGYLSLSTLLPVHQPAGIGA